MTLNEHYEWIALIDLKIVLQKKFFLSKSDKQLLQRTLDRIDFLGKQPYPYE